SNRQAARTQRKNSSLLCRSVPPNRMALPGVYTLMMIPLLFFLATQQPQQLEQQLQRQQQQLQQIQQDLREQQTEFRRLVETLERQRQEQREAFRPVCSVELRW